MKMKQLGWNPEREAAFHTYQQQGWVPGRVAMEHTHLYRVLTEEGDVLAEVSGRMRHEAAGRADYPAVGDWVALAVRQEEGRATIHGVLPRVSKFSRRAAGPTVEEQIVATNIDTVFLVSALNLDFNLRRLERYLTLAWESGANPVIVLSKADLSDRVEALTAEAAAIAPGVPVLPVSSVEGQGLEQLEPYLKEGETVALLGSSGAGKSTLINRLMGSERLRTGGIREGDDRGKHTTTHRELVVLPGGGMLIDTPGMRELQMWEAEEGLSGSFADVEELASTCRFPDCRHDREPGCAVKQALENGTLPRSRFDNYGKLQKELAFLARKENKSLQAAHKDKWKKIHQAAKQRSNRE
ncbi:ribosome small subunit-dependent GTPase [Paenibacillus sp. J31TS4]|uniref:ribosome small subunit-dependent GTPase A n=1 Tax=Paenibacillus sp. J31TS4 TaxID=2807195 RepID=UPI001B2ED99A|nr:ribosome small subunit-dependent GTPase A [Paenibacillus sp. J31TS4]GIP39100.1 ribosome small subunit-dependent GTPase [Paenibacillus sp. J31TS4]